MGSTVHQTTGTLPIAFPRTTIQTNPSQLVFHANTSLESTTEIVSYFKDYDLGFAMLCGLKFLYSGCSNALLGEDSQKSQTIRLSHPIQSICVHYTQCYGSQYLIVGLMFTAGDVNVRVGNCKGQNPDVLHLDQVCSPSPLISPC
jgi:hypothetical protein